MDGQVYLLVIVAGVKRSLYQQESKLARITGDR